MRTSRKAWKLLDSWVSTPDLEPRVLTRLEGRPQERNLLHIGEVCSWYLYEWVCPVQQVALANPWIPTADPFWFPNTKCPIGQASLRSQLKITVHQ